MKLRIAGIWRVNWLTAVDGLLGGGVTHAHTRQQNKVDCDLTFPPLSLAHPLLCRTHTQLVPVAEDTEHALFFSSAQLPHDITPCPLEVKRQLYLHVNVLLQ